MRNPVSRHDFNRASVHPDRKKDFPPGIEDGLSEWETDKFYQGNKEEVDSLIADLRMGSSSSPALEALKLLDKADFYNKSSPDL